MPVTVVPTSLATVAIDTFITELSSVIRNWPAASVSSTTWPPVRTLPLTATRRVSVYVGMRASKYRTAASPIAFVPV